MKRPKVSFITTVLNEEKTIGKLLDSLTNQTKKPDEIVVVDAGSTDRTVEITRKFCKKTRTRVSYYTCQGANRAKGRNEAIKRAIGEIIVMADAGCELKNDWLENIIRPFKNPKVDVVSGYYRAKAKTIFERCVAPYALVMPDRVNPQNFLPSSRSMALRKKVWQTIGGFPEKFSDNEDYVFAGELKKRKAKIVFCQNSVVSWYPRSNLKDFFIMIYRFARGDTYAGLRYKKVATVFLRYLIGAFLFYQSVIWGLLSLLFYCFWAVEKNYRYVKHPLAFIYLPLLQLTADLAVMTGTLRGFVKRL